MMRFFLQSLPYRIFLPNVVLFSELMLMVQEVGGDGSLTECKNQSQSKVPEFRSEPPAGWMVAVRPWTAVPTSMVESNMSIKSLPSKEKCGVRRLVGFPNITHTSFPSSKRDIQ